MPRSQDKSIRKLVTLPPELAERVERYRQSTSAASESEALKALIEDGLKLHDTPTDLFERFETAIRRGLSIGEIINILAADHPLVASTFLNHDSLMIYLKPEHGENEERFVFDRINKRWDWERHLDDYNNDAWESLRIEKPKRPTRSTAADLDDEIPF